MSSLPETISVLHVDDDPSFGELVRTFLEREDACFTIDTANNPDDAIDRIGDNRYECIVSDYDMPEQTGIELLEVIREEHPDLPFILYTGKGSEEIASDAISAGVTDYLQKEAGTSQYTVLANRIKNAVEQHRTRIDLTEREERLNLFFEQSPLGVIEWDERFRINRMNDAAEEILGFDYQRLVGESWGMIVPERDREAVQEVVSELLENKGGYHSINENIRGNGERIICEWHNRVITDDNDEVMAIFSQFQDITERREHRHQLEAALNNHPGYVYRHGYEEGWPLEYVKGNPASVTGYTVTELEELVLAENIIHAADQADVREEVAAGIEADGQYDITYRIVTKDDEIRWIRDIGRRSEHPVTGEPKLEGLVIDVTEQSERERELKQSTSLLSTLFDTLPVGVLAEDADRNVHAVNEEMFTLFELPESPDDVHGADCEQMAEQVSEMFVDSTGFVDRINELVASREPSDNEEVLLTDGRTFERDYRPLDLPDGQGHLWVYKDITEQKQQRRKYEAIFNQTYHFTGVLAPDGTLIEANETALTFGDLDREEVIGQKLWDTAWFQHSTETRERAKAAVTRAAQGEFVRHELPVQGATRDAIFDFSVRPVTDEQGHVIFVIPEGRDITDLKDRERSLRRERDRLDEFAGVVSHDLRNPLSVAQGRLELAENGCDSDHLAAIETALDRIDRLTEDVLWLAREGRDIGSVGPVKLHETIDTAWNIVADRVTGAALRYDDEKCARISIEADEDRLCQLMENLFRNAIAHAGEDVTVTVGTVETGFYVEDDGPGIPEERRENVFVPGYSTADEGTGFGLSIAKQIIEAHDWEVRITDGVTGGARFEITGLESFEE